MKKKLSILILVFVASTVFIGMFIYITNIENNPKRIIEKYYQYTNEDKFTEVDKLMYKPVNDDVQIDRVKEIKLLDVEETEYQVNNFKDKGFYETKVFRVEYFILFKEGVSSPITDGEYDTFFWLIKEEKNSLWKIIEIGY